MVKVIKQCIVLPLRSAGEQTPLQASLLLTCPVGKRSCEASSPRSRLWLSDLRIFMMRTMAASI